MDHSFGKAYAARAYRRLWDGKKADAQADVEKAIEVSPKDYAGYLVKAKVVSHSVVSCQDGIEKSREAIKLVSKAISLEPKLCDLYLTRAAYNSGAGQLDAGDVYKRQVQIDSVSCHNSDSFGGGFESEYSTAN